MMRITKESIGTIKPVIILAIIDKYFKTNSIIIHKDHSWDKWYKIESIIHKDNKYYKDKDKDKEIIALTIIIITTTILTYNSNNNNFKTNHTIIRKIIIITTTPILFNSINSTSHSHKCI